ncbi:hypothetical protein [Methylobacterium iners]|uniref:Uncharacterized protein n=1 Tax=Methylobacterium iners TaxID=418707 RepID=A0ABQ4RSH5_9HYPH|nr:hypothetical protein [Methylobacterium iners]GJD92927.1 hypothetical protein OCOJLMKI_0110 [Methylobacterium iners]
MSRKPVPAPAVQPWTPITPDRFDVFALKALQEGKASEGQQKRALALIITQIAATYDLPFRPGGSEGDRATAFASGKQFVGQQIVRLLNFDVDRLPQSEST